MTEEPVKYEGQSDVNQNLVGGKGPQYYTGRQPMLCSDHGVLRKNGVGCRRVTHLPECGSYGTGLIISLGDAWESGVHCQGELVKEASEKVTLIRPEGHLVRVPEYPNFGTVLGRPVDYVPAHLWRQRLGLVVELLAQGRISSEPR